MSFEWMIGGRAFNPAPFPDKPEGAAQAIAPYCLWGIVNVTPDSFSDGGRHMSLDAALCHARRLQSQGAAVLDMGGASSRPGAEDIGPAEESARVLPVIEALVADRKKTSVSSPLLSVDTWRAEVARDVLEAGADIINDISACAWEPELRDVLATYRPAYVLMHCQGRPGFMQAAPHYDNVVDDVMAFWDDAMKMLVKAGLPEKHIILDPGIGFGKTLEHNMALLAALERLQTLGRPLLLGVSRKSMFADLFALPVDRRDDVTALCVALAAEKGVCHHRVHDVESAWRALDLVRRLTPM